MQKVAQLVPEAEDFSYRDEPTPRQATAGSEKASQLSCLLMDDNDFDRKFIRRIAEKSRYEIELVETASIKETRDRLAHRNVDILLADYRVPDGNGISFAGDLVKANKHAPQVIVVTGEGDSNSAIEAIRAGAADYLPKGDITLDLFDNAIENAIRARGRATRPDEMPREQAVEALKSLQKITLAHSHELKAATLPLIALGWQVSQGKMITGAKRDDLSAKIHGLAHRIPEILDDLVIASVCGLAAEPEMKIDLSAMVRDILANTMLHADACHLDLAIGHLPSLNVCPKRMRMLLEALINASIAFCPHGSDPEIKISAARDPSGNPIIVVQDNGVPLDVRKQTLGNQMASLRIAGTEGDPFVWSMCQCIAASLGAALKIKSGPGNLTTVMLRFDKACLA